MLTLSGSRAWIGLAGLLGTGAVAVTAFGFASTALDWQPQRALHDPWRWWSAAFVHFSALHLLGNLIGLALLASLGQAAQLPPRCALAWAVAWPITHLALVLRPDLAHYGGLSGVLHAGVVIAGWHLVRHQARTRQRLIGSAMLLGVLIKLWLEAPWGPALRHPADWDIAVAPLAHTTGAIAGLLCALCFDRPASRPAAP